MRSASTRHIPAWAVYVLLFLGIMAGFGAMGFWHVTDWRMYELLPGSGKEDRLSGEIVIVDIPYNDNNEIFRSTVAGLLNALNRDIRDAPKGVALDIAFYRDDRGITPLIESIDQLRLNKILVFAGVDPRRENSPDIDPNYRDRHYTDLYDAHVDGSGHTWIKDRSFTYEPYLDLGSQSIPSLATTIAETLYGCKVLRVDKERIVHRVDMAVMCRHIFSFNGGHWCTYPLTGAPQEVPKPEFRGKLVIVGCLKKDIVGREAIPGPLFVTWALNDYILPASEQSKFTIVPEVFHLIILLLSVVTTLFVFAGFARSGKQISIHPVRLAIVSGASGLFAVSACIGLPLLMKHINPYVTIPVFGGLLSAGLAGRYWHGVLGERAFLKRNDEWLAPPAHEYDLFISYSHEPENAEWVRKNIVEPLCAARKFDGSLLRVFFDTHSITVGVSWHRKITRSIYLSRHFLPVYSFDYFKRDYCNYEMEHASAIHVHNKDFIMPVVHELPVVPDEYKLIQYTDAKTNPSFLADIIAKLTAHPDEGQGH